MAEEKPFFADCDCAIGQKEWKGCCGWLDASAYYFLESVLNLGWSPGKSTLSVEGVTEWLLGELPRILRSERAEEAVDDYIGGLSGMARISPEADIEGEVYDFFATVAGRSSAA